MITVWIICLIGFGVMLYGSSLSFVTFSDEEITFRHAFSQEKEIYSWEDIKEINYNDDLTGEASPFYQFQFEDKQELEIVQNGILTEEIRIRIDHKARENNISFERVFK